MLTGWFVASTVGFACNEVEYPWPRSQTPQVVSISADSSGRTTFEFGPGALLTTNDDRWGGEDWLVLPPTFDLTAGPFTLEIVGLDLSDIRYEGDLGWPPDPGDRGAFVTLQLSGDAEVTHRIRSTLADAEGLWDGSEIGPDASADYRAYRFEGWQVQSKLKGQLQFRPERWGSGESDRFDLRLVYEDGGVGFIARLHESWSWNQGDSASGADCPWNPALNTAVSGTEDEVWRGECSDPEAGATGRSLGAWREPVEGSWGVAEKLRIARVRIGIANWVHARGPYEVSWESIRLTGVRASGARVSQGQGQLVPMGRARSIEASPQGGAARFSFFVVSSSGGRPGTAMWSYLAPGLEVTGTATQWTIIEPSSVRFAGQAKVNGEPGYEYTVSLETAGQDGAPARLDTRVWRKFESPAFPMYLGFGEVTDLGVTYLPASGPDSISD